MLRNLGVSGVSLDFDNPTRTRTLKKGKQSAAARPSAAEKRGSWVSPNYDTTQHALAQKKAKRSGQAECSGIGVTRRGSGISPD
jgi:hypothetical protein